MQRNSGAPRWQRSWTRERKIEKVPRGIEGFATLRAFIYRDASHLWRSSSHNITKINIQFLNTALYVHVVEYNTIHFDFEKWDQTWHFVINPHGNMFEVRIRANAIKYRYRTQRLHKTLLNQWLWYHTEELQVLEV